MYPIRSKNVFKAPAMAGLSYSKDKVIYIMKFGLQMLIILKSLNLADLYHILPIYAIPKQMGQNKFNLYFFLDPYYSKYVNLKI